jgi:hypothetical protein
MKRFLMRCVGVEVEVYDATTGDYDTAVTVFGPASHQTASKYAADMNLSEPSPSTVPSCDCPAERYRHALAQIHRHSPCPIAQRYADEALFAAARAKGEAT